MARTVARLSTLNVAAVNERLVLLQDLCRASLTNLLGSNLSEASVVVWLVRFQEEKSLAIVSPEKTLLARDSG